jgi:hypothetical protein
MKILGPLSKNFLKIEDGDDRALSKCETLLNTGKYMTD